MSNLILPVKRIWFDEFLAGAKPYEYRLANDYWSKRLIGRKYDSVIVTLGYPAHDQADRRLVFKWNGSKIITLTHPHFGAWPVQVFAIDCTERIKT